MITENFDAIDLLTGNTFMITWDTGRRCNYDCSYCPVHRHDNFSPHATVEQLNKGVDFIFSYVPLIMQYKSWKYCNIGFTGGEPTVNPNFIPFIQQIRDREDESFTLQLSLTTNGAMGRKTAQKVGELFDFATVSYHVEADKKVKNNVIDTIEYFAGIDNFDPKVNVMLHADPKYFEECVNLCEYFDKKNISYIPRVIEHGNAPYNLYYSQEQLEWMDNFFGSKESKKQDKNEGGCMGRPCCGGRDMRLSNDFETAESTYVGFRNFKDWYCSVNWFFLHIEQQSDLIYHHQTCQARLDGTRGAIGTLSEHEKIVEDLRRKIESKSMPVVKCPNTKCGCGLCAPKAKNHDKFSELISNHITDTSIFGNNLNE